MKGDPIKKRIISKADEYWRRIWVADNELLKTRFKPGTHFTYKIEKNQITILPSEVGNTVARRNTKQGTTAIIDIRKNNALEAFKGADELELEIYDDVIIVKGIKKVISFAKKKVIAQATILRSELLNSSKIVSGAEGEQLSMFESCLSDIGSQSAEILTSIKQDLPLVINVASFFSGAGIMDFGFKKEGFNLVYAVEIDKNAAMTYRYNLGDHIVCGDINKIDFQSIPDTPVIIAGSPCQDLSNANRVSRILDSPKNRLIRTFIEVIKAKVSSCLVFLLENVPQIITAGGGRFIEEIRRELPDFEITVNRVNSADYGSAQKRERAFIIGSRIGRIEMTKPILKTAKTVRNAFAGLDDSIPNQTDFTKPSPDTVARMLHVPQGGNWVNIPESLRTKGRQSNFYRRLMWDEPSITIVNPRKAMILHPEQNRIISVREACDLFDLPRDYVIKGSSLDSRQQQICNAVPASLSRAAARIIKEAIESYLFSTKNLITFPICTI